MQSHANHCGANTAGLLGQCQKTTSKEAQLILITIVCIVFIYLFFIIFYLFINVFIFCSFWPVIDNALRKASLEKGVKVRLLASKWNHTKSDMYNYLQSLVDVGGAMDGDIQVV